MKLLRRFLVLMTFAFWQGGFLFYTSVVVTIGQDVLGSSLEQGFITRRVTQSMNLAGVVALVPLLWDMLAGGGKSAVCLAGRWLAFLGMTATLAALFWLHPQLDALIDHEAHAVSDRRVFYGLHRSYLWISTAQWGCGVAYLALTLWAWRDEDRAPLIK